VLGVPVRVGLSFWLVAFVFGPKRPLPVTLAWLAIVFVSVLVHELGHALMARRFGAEVFVQLHAFGGRTLFVSLRELPRSKRAAISIAGPLAGMLLGAIVLVAAAHGDVRQMPTLFRTLFLDVMSAFVNGTTPPSLTPAMGVAALLLFVNFGWGLINLLPVLPFDGGALLAAAFGPRHAFAATVISASVGASVAAWALSRGVVYLPTAALFAFGAYLSVNEAREALAAQADARAGLQSMLREAKDALAAGDNERAMMIAAEVLTRARTRPMRNGARIAEAWAHVGRGDGQRAQAALGEIQPPGAVDPFTLAAVEDAAGHPRQALSVLLSARKIGLRAREMTKLLVDLYARQGELTRAMAIAIEDAPILTVDDLRAVIGAAADAGEHGGAADLATIAFSLHHGADDLVTAALERLRAGDPEAAARIIARALEQGWLTRARVVAEPLLAPLLGEPL
jgi:Zn-dependent protease